LININMTMAIPEKIDPWYCPQTKNNMQQISVTKKRIISDVYRINKPFQETRCWTYIMRYITPKMSSFHTDWEWMMNGHSFSKVLNYQQSKNLKPKNMLLWYTKKRTHSIMLDLERTEMKIVPYDKKSAVAVSIKPDKKKRSFSLKITENTCYLKETELYDQWKNQLITKDPMIGGELYQVDNVKHLATKYQRKKRPKKVNYQKILKKLTRSEVVQSHVTVY